MADDDVHDTFLESTKDGRRVGTVAPTEPGGPIAFHDAVMTGRNTIVVKAR
jgi:hypothetical protein